MPALRAEPDAGAAPRSASSNVVTHESHAARPTRVAQRVDRIDAHLRVQQAEGRATTRSAAPAPSPRRATTSRRTAYGAPDAPVMATTIGGFVMPPTARRARAIGRRVHQPLDQHAREKDDADHAVHREERGVEPREVVGLDERVLVHEQARGHRDAKRVERTARPAPERRGTHGRETQHRSDVQTARDAQRARSAERRRQRMKSLLTIEVDVLERVQHVESAAPRRDARAPARRASTTACSIGRSPRGIRPPERSTSRRRARGDTSE